MPTINVSDIVNDDSFAFSWQLLRSNNTPGFGPGGYSTGTTTLNVWGPVQKATAKEIEMLPEGDRVGEIRKFMSQQPIYTTELGRGPSDICIWHGLQFRVIQCDLWPENGYYRAFATRMLGA